MGPIAVAPAGEHVDARNAVQPRNLSRLAFSLVGSVLLLFLLESTATNRALGWPVVAEYLFDPLVLQGVLLTIVLTVITMVFGSLLGLLLAVGRLSSAVVFRWPAAAYIWVFRGTPLLIQIIFWFNLALLIPRVVLGVPFGPTLFAANTNDLISPLTAAILALGLNEGAHMAEIFRGGILSVDPGQAEAAQALGMGSWRTMRRVVLPQAMPAIIPPTGNEVLGVLKATALVSVIALGELLRSVEDIYNRTFQTIPLLLVACAWYLILTYIWTVVQTAIEGRLGAGLVAETSRRSKFGGQLAAETGRPGSNEAANRDA